MVFFLLLCLRTQEIMQESPKTPVYLRSPGLWSVKRIHSSALISGLIYSLLTPFSWTLYSSALSDMRIPWSPGVEVNRLAFRCLSLPSVSQTSPASPASLHAFCLPRALCPDLASSNHSLLAPGYFP